MTNKILSYLSFGITVLTLILVGVLVFTPASKNFGAEGDTNYTNLVLSGTLAVTGASTHTGAATFASTVAVTGETRAPLVETGSATVLTSQATSTAVTLTAAQVCNSNVIQWDIQTVSTTLNLPTVVNTVADCLTADGDTISFLFDNISTSTGAIVTIASSTWEFVGVANTNDLIDGENQARIDLTRISATAGFAEIVELVAAD